MKRQPDPKTPSKKTAPNSNTESIMRKKWEDMPKDLEFKKDSADIKNAIKDYRSVQIMYPKMSDPRSLATSGTSGSGDLREKKKVESGLKAMKASVKLEKVVSKRKGDKEFYDKMKLNKKLRNTLE